MASKTTLEQTQTDTPAASATTAPAKKRGRWRRRLLVAALTLAVVTVGLRIVLHFALPSVLARVAATYNLDLRYARHTLTLLGGEAGLWKVNVLPRSGGEPLLHAEYVHGNLSIWQLLKGNLQVWRAEADGVDMLVERTADGRIPLLEHFASGASSSEPPAPQPQDTPPPDKVVEFKPPISVEAIRLNKVRVRLRDKFVQPAVEGDLIADIRVTDIGVHNPPLHFAIDVWSDRLMDLLRVEGQAQSTGPTITASASVVLRGLHPKAIAGYIRPIGLRAVSDTVNGALNVRLDAKALPSLPGAISCALVLDKMELTADGTRAAELKQVRVDVDSLSGKALNIGTIVVEGGRFDVTRTRGGMLGAAGLALASPTDAPETPGASRVVAQPDAAPTTQPGMSVAMRSLHMRDLEARFDDASTTPPTSLRLIVADVTARAPDDATAPDAPMAVDGKLAAPGIARQVTFNGTVAPFANAKTADLTFRAEGIRPDLLEPYFRAAGIESRLRDATAAGGLRASVAAGRSGEALIDAHLSTLALSDGDELVALDGIDVGRLCISSDDDGVKIESIEVRGPQIELVRAADGSIRSCGFLVHPPGATPPAARSDEPSAPAPATAPAPAPIAIPRVELARFTWKDAQLRIRDEMVEPATTIDLQDAGVEIRDLYLDLTERPQAAQTQPARTGSIKAWLTSPQLAERLSLEGSLHPGRQSLAAELRVRGEKLTPAPLAPYVKSLGVEPVMTDGSVRADAKLAVARRSDGALDGSLEVTNAALADAGQALAGVEAVRLAGLTLAPEMLTVDNLEIRAPSAHVTRDTDGSLLAGGVRFRPPASGSAAAPSAPATTQPVAAPAARFAASLTKLRLQDGKVRWTDRAASPAVDTTAHIDVDVDRLTVGKPAAPGSVAVRLSADGVARMITLGGSVDATPGKSSARLDVDAQGVTGVALAPYLPPGTEIELKDGRFRAAIEADVTDNPRGGQGLRIAVQKLDYRDGAADSTVLLGWDSFVLSAPRLDPAGDVFAVDEVSLAGLQTSASMGADGKTRALGLAIGPAPARPAAQPPAAPPHTPDTSSATAPVAQQDVASLVAEARRPLPLFTLEKLDLNVRRAALTLSRGDAAGDAEPLVLSDVRLRNVTPLVLGGATAESQPPVKLELTGRATPVVSHFGLLAEASPFATEPAASLELTADGIRGQGITEFLPDLAERIDGSRLTDGRFRASAQAHAKFARRGPRDFDLARGFDLDLLLKDVALRQGLDGPVLAGVQAIEADTIRIQPKDGRVHAKSLEITKPVAIASRDAEGLHLLGLTIVQTAGKSQPESPAAQPVEAPEAPEAPATAGAGEIRVDRLLVSGLDFRFEDRAVQPVVLVPLNALDVEVRDLSSRALVENRPIRFNVAMGADKVPVPRRSKGGNDAADSTAVLASQNPGSAPEASTDATDDLEQRELFSQISANGTVSLYPQPSGFARASANGVELAAFRGLASEAGVELGGGVFDGTVDVRFRDAGAMNARTKVVLTDLSLSEPEGGPITRGLALPAPLDAVIGIMEDPDGSITLRLDVPIEEGKVSGGAVAASATAALTQLIATAVASAPIKVVGGVGELVGGGKDAAPQGPQPVTIGFAGGDAELNSASRQRLDELVKLMRKDRTVEVTIRHELGGADLTSTGSRANPPTEDCRALAARMRQRKAQLSSERAWLAAQSRAALASGSTLASPQQLLHRLRELDRQIAQTEDGLDQLYELLRPGADRQAARRTRAACLQLGEQRVAAVRDTLASAGVSRDAERVRTTAATFNPSGADTGGQVVITVVQKKRS
jgi:hypothetical protein